MPGLKQNIITLLNLDLLLCFRTQLVKGTNKVSAPAAASGRTATTSNNNQSGANGKPRTKRTVAMKAKKSGSAKSTPNWALIMAKRRRAAKMKKASVFSRNNVSFYA